jgi:phage shock protein B
MDYFFRSLTRPECLVFMIPIIAIVMAGVVKIYRMKLEARHGGDFSGKGGAKLSAEDVQTIQELHRGFEKLSDRVEALETILLDRARKG